MDRSGRTVSNAIQHATSRALKKTGLTARARVTVTITYHRPPGSRRVNIEEEAMTEVSSEQRGSIAVITIDNPPVNALSQAVRSGLMTAIDQADGDDRINAIVIVCHGRTFVAGADIREFDKLPMRPYATEFIARIEACEKPVVAGLHGTLSVEGSKLHWVAITAIALTSRASRSSGSHSRVVARRGGYAAVAAPGRYSQGARHHDLGETCFCERGPRYGVIDRLLDGGDLVEATIAYAEELVERGAGPRRIRDMRVEPVDDGFFEEYRESIAGKTRGLMSPERIIRCVEALFTRCRSMTPWHSSANSFSNARSQINPLRCAMCFLPSARSEKFRAVCRCRPAQYRERSGHRRRHDGCGHRLRLSQCGSAGNAAGQQPNRL